MILGLARKNATQRTIVEEVGSGLYVVRNAYEGQYSYWNEEPVMVETWCSNNTDPQNVLNAKFDGELT